MTDITEWQDSSSSVLGKLKLDYPHDILSVKRADGKLLARLTTDGVMHIFPPDGTERIATSDEVIAIYERVSRERGWSPLERNG